MSQLTFEDELLRVIRLSLSSASDNLSLQPAALILPPVTMTSRLKAVPIAAPSLSQTSLELQARSREFIASVQTDSLAASSVLSNYYSALVDKYALQVESPRALQPASIKIPLKAHQLAVIHRASLLEQGTLQFPEGQLNTRIGILCDYTGAGKSYTMLGLIASNKLLQPHLCSEVIWHQSNISLISTPTLVAGQAFVGSNLIIIPDGLLSQWIKYIECTKLTCLVIRTLNSLPTSYSPYDVVLLPASNCRDFHMLINQELMWSRVFYDEADSINIPSNPRFNSAFWWFVTATPGQLLRRTPNRGFISRTFAKADNMITLSFIKCKDSFVQQSFNLAEPIIQIVLCKAPDYVNRLHKILPRNVLSALVAGDISAAVNALGIERVNSNEHIVTMFTRSLKRQLDERNAFYLYSQSLPTASPALQLSKLKTLELVAKEIKLLEDKIYDLEQLINQNICYICFDEPLCSTFTKCCKKVSCLLCIMQYIDIKNGRCDCPNCRAPMTKNELITVHRDEEASLSAVSSAPLVDSKNKLQAFEQWLAQNMSPEKRVLFFTEYDGGFDKILQILERLRVPYAILSGSGAEKTAKMIASYKSGVIKLLLINSNSHGAGFNLENTTDTLIYHKMNSNREAQSIGRANRPGRLNALRVTKFVYDMEL